MGQRVNGRRRFSPGNHDACALMLLQIARNRVESSSVEAVSPDTLADSDLRRDRAMAAFSISLGLTAQ